MRTKLKIGSCSFCGYPIGVNSIGEQIACPMCGERNEAIPISGSSSSSTSGPIRDISVPTWFITLCVGFGIGLIAGPAIIASTKSGAAWLERQAVERIR